MKYLHYTRNFVSSRTTFQQPEIALDGGNGVGDRLLDGLKLVISGDDFTQARARVAKNSEVLDQVE